MEKKGWLTLTVEHQNGKPSRKVYHITQAGQKEFKRWLPQPPEVPELRNAMLIKIFFGNQMEPAQFTDHLRGWREYHANLLKRYGKEIPSVIKQYANATGAHEDAFYWTLTLDYGRRLDRMVLQWCDEALKQIEDTGKKESRQKKSMSLSKKSRKKLH
jgi:DNA-binding PadR family transcriptional regulator